VLRAALLPDFLIVPLGWIINLLILAILARVILSYFPGTMYTTGGRLLARVTDPIIDPIRRVVPPLGMIDLSPAIAIVLLYVLQILITTADVVLALVRVVQYVLVLVIILLLIRVLFGFFRLDPWNPFVQMIVQGSEPFARPFRRWLPRKVGTFDWAPIAAMVVLVAAYYVVSWLGSQRI
jgi:YggT family protein